MQPLRTALDIYDESYCRRGERSLLARILPRDPGRFRRC